MDANIKSVLKIMLRNQEDYRQYPYLDTTGHMTIGIGRNLSDRGISLIEAFEMLDNDIDYFEGRLSNALPWFDALDSTRKIVLINMCFNLGTKGFFSFKKMLQCVSEQDFMNAADEMLNSLWAEQVGERACVLADIMRTGELKRITPSHDKQENTM